MRKIVLGICLLVVMSGCIGAGMPSYMTTEPVMQQTWDKVTGNKR